MSRVMGKLYMCQKMHVLINHFDMEQNIAKIGKACTLRGQAKVTGTYSWYVRNAYHDFFVD